MKPVEAVKRKNGCDTVEFGKFNTLPVNTILLAYATPRSVRQHSIFNVMNCTYGGNELNL